MAALSTPTNLGILRCCASFGHRHEEYSDVEGAVRDTVSNVGIVLRAALPHAASCQLLLLRASVSRANEMSCNIWNTSVLHEY